MLTSWVRAWLVCWCTSGILASSWSASTCGWCSSEGHGQSSSQGHAASASTWTHKREAERCQNVQNSECAFSPLHLRTILLQPPLLVSPANSKSFLRLLNLKNPQEINGRSKESCYNNSTSRKTLANLPRKTIQYLNEIHVYVLNKLQSKNHSTIAHCCNLKQTRKHIKKLKLHDRLSDLTLKSKSRKKRCCWPWGRC